MKKLVFVKKTLLVALTMSYLFSAVMAAAWKTYRSEDYGFSMLVPEGTTFAEREFGGGWGGLVADADGVEIWAVGKMGEQATVDEIENYGVKVTGISAANWKKVDGGTNSNGWVWYKGVEAWDGDQVIYGGYGVGPEGSYLLLVKTTGADYSSHKADYRKWFDSLAVF